MNALTRTGIAWVLGLLMLVGVACVLRPEPTPPPQPILVEWLVDKEYGDKSVMLPNGLELTVYQEAQESEESSTSTSTVWHWTVGAPAASEREAMDKALHMGGVK